MDVKTLFIINILICFFMSLSVYYYMFFFKSRKGLGWWASADLFIAFFFAFTILRLYWNTPVIGIFSIIIGNSGLCCVLILRLNCIKLFFGKKSVSYLYLIIPALAFILFFYFYIVSDNVHARTFSISIIFAFLSLMIAREFIINRAFGIRRLNLLMAGLYMFFCLANLTRGILAVSDTAYRFAENVPVDVMYFLIVPILSVTFTVCFLLINAQYFNYEMEAALEEKNEFQKALASSEDKFRKLFSWSPNIISFNTLDEGRYIEVNHNFEKMLGWGRNEIIGRTAKELGIFKDYSLRTKMADIVKKNGFINNHHCELVTRSGKTIECEIFGELVTIDNIPCLLAHIIDITERKAAEEERRLLEEKLHIMEKHESLSVLAGGVAHDFSNALMAIVGSADVGMLNVSKLSPVRPVLENIKKASMQASLLCNKMLAYSGEGRLVNMPLNLTGLISEMKDQLESLVGGKIKVHYSLDDELPDIEADISQMRQVMLDLVANAKEAIGVAEGNIIIGTDKTELDKKYIETALPSEELQEDIYIRLTVTDDGCGMDSETKVRIFDPFFSTKFTGRGLGLAAVQGIVRSHMGAIDVTSEPGKGSTFTIFIPAAKDSPADIIS